MALSTVLGSALKAGARVARAPKRTLMAPTRLRTLKTKAARGPTPTEEDRYDEPMERGLRARSDAPMGRRFRDPYGSRLGFGAVPTFSSPVASLPSVLPSIQEMMGDFMQDGDPSMRARLRDESDLGALAAISSFMRDPAMPMPFQLDVDVEEDDNAYIVHADVPGFTAADLSLTYDEKTNTITITGERKRELEKEEGKFRRSERHVGKFTRKFTLPIDADLDKVESATRAGILTVKVPKSEEAKPHMKEIPIVDQS